MNIAYFLTPKQEVATIYDDCTIRQGLEKMRYHGYSEIPVVTHENQYVGVVSEGDFLWYLVEKNGTLGSIDSTNMERLYLKDAISLRKNPAVRITTTMDQLLQRAMESNFIPVVDDRGSFVGIITRKAVMKYFYQKEIKK